MTNKSIGFLTRTALLLAVTVLFQSLRVLVPIPPSMSQYIIGSLVNLALIVAAVMVGMKGGLIIAVLAPVIAFLQGFLPPFPIMIILIGIGNAVLVIIVSLFYHKNKYMAIIFGAIVKFVVLYIGVVLIGVPFLLANAPQPLRTTLSIQFSWPQLVTAFIGGLIALAVIPLLKKAKI